MFDVILYAWVVLTAVVVFLILRFLYAWLVAILQRNNTPSTTRAFVDTDAIEGTGSPEDDYDDKETLLESLEIDDSVEDNIVELPWDVTPEEVVVPDIETDIRETDAGVIIDTVMTEHHGDVAIVTETVSIIPSHEDGKTQSVDTADSSMGADETIATPQDNATIDQPEAIVPTAPSAQISVASRSTGFQSDATMAEIEVPKDLDGARNIGQGHSRDDIVRDKFEKHIAKIRYDAGILKQRNDILGYEKKLVEGLTLIPTDKLLQRQLADLYFQQGKYKKAHSLLKKILTDSPEDHMSLWQLGEITLEEGNREDAYVYFSKAYALCDDNPTYCLSLAQRFYDQGDYQSALPMMEKVVKLRPKQIDYLVSLSHVQLKLGLRDEAKQSLLRAQELDPMNIALKQYLKAL